MEIVNKSVEKYIEEYTSDESPLLHHIWRQTNLRTFYPNMVSGKVQGEFLRLVIFMLKPERVLEVGTFTGYSAVAMASAMPETGKIITIDNNEEIESITREFIEHSGLKNKIDFICGDALEFIPKLNEKLDLVFVDADKEQYTEYYHLVFPLVKNGGFILADNVLWGGKAIEKPEKTDKETTGIRNFNELVKNDDRVEQVMLSIRDGLLLIRKK
jgi:predicted O-methyltransferase YrrM